MYVSLSRKYVLCQFLGKNGHNFNKYSIKLLNEALIGKMSRNKSWSNLKLSYEYVYIKNVHMFVSPKMVFFVNFCNFLQNGEAIYEFRPIQKKRFFLDMDIGSYQTWPSPRKTEVSTFFIFRKRLQTIYNKMKSYKATKLSGYALESWDSQLSNAHPVSSVAL